MSEGNENQPIPEHPGGSQAMIPATPARLARIEAMEPSVDGVFASDPMMFRGTFPRSHSMGPSIFRLFRHKWLIFTVFILISGLAVPAIWIYIPPTYLASAVVRVSPVGTRVVFKTEDNEMVPLYRSYLNTQVSIIRSPALLERVLDDPNVQQTAWYREPTRTLRVLMGGPPPSQLERLIKDLSVRPRNETELIDVSMTLLNSRDAAVIVNSVVDEYDRYSGETLRESDIRRFGTLTSERAQLENEIDGLLATQFNLSNRVGTLGPEQVRSQLATHLSVLESEYEKLQRESLMTQWELESLRKKNAAEGSTEAAPVQEEPALNYLRDPEWRSLKLELERLRNDLELAQQQFGASHPKIKQMTASVDQAKGLVLEREEQLNAQWEGDGPPIAPVSAGTVAAMDPAALDWLMQRQSRELGLLHEEIERQRTKVSDAGAIAQEMAHYDEEIRNKREMHEAIRTRLQTLELESKAPARIGVAAHAIESSEPHRDRRIIFTVMALAAAMLTSMGTAYLRSMRHPKILEAMEVRDIVHTPFLGQLPLLAMMRKSPAETDPFFLQSMRMIRTALLERLLGTDRRVVLITGASTQAGKTTVAIELAKSLAHMGKRILLVEADLRRPAIAARTGLASRLGLSALLNGVADDDQVILTGHAPNLDVVVAGEGVRGIDEDTELLANGVLSACLARWKQSYDYILLDSPPLLPVADARILAGQADGIIMVLRSSHCRRSEALQACADVCNSGGKLLGTVLVGGRSRTSYGYYYGYGYSQNSPPSA